MIKNKRKRGFFLQYTAPLLLLGLSAGFVNGLLGAGGGILVVYGLRRIMKGKLSDGRAIYASAIAVMLPLSALSALQYFKSGHLPAGSFLATLLPALAGGVLGALLLCRISLPGLSRLFAAVVLVSGIVMVI